MRSDLLQEIEREVEERVDGWITKDGDHYAVVRLEDVLAIIKKHRQN